MRTFGYKVCLPLAQSLLRSKIYSELYLHSESGYLSQTTGYGLDGRSSIPGRGKRFLSSPQCPDRLSGSPSLVSNGHREDLSPGVKWQEREADQAITPSAEVKNDGAIRLLCKSIRGVVLK
jgi:hypothetical protein